MVLCAEDLALIKEFLFSRSFNSLWEDTDSKYTKLAKLGSGKGEMKMALLATKWRFAWVFYQFSEPLLHWF